MEGRKSVANNSQPLTKAKAPQPPRTGTAVRITTKKSNSELREILQQICSKYLKDAEENTQPDATYNTQFCEVLNKAIASSIELTKTIPNPIELSDVLVQYFPTFTKLIMLRTLYQVRQNLPRYMQRSFDKRIAEFQVFSYGYDEDEYVDEFGDNCTKWFECYTTTQFEFDFLEFNAATIHIIALYLSEQQQDLADGDVVTVVMETPEQFGKKKSLIAKFVPGHQLFQRTEVFCIPGTKFFVKSELKQRYNVSFNYTLYNVFDPEEDFFPEAMEEEEEEKHEEEKHEESSEFTPED
ncbi:hypothetical protein TVAGG3_0750080 [Trichomonas vaginalis G3]|nr:hypothetical protein TVAGG3_0750080 [Trichomonas vaginalis G3]KAI5512475.1 hypothetical protein TVAGG3_0750080 [Trichomonas vaginalis G3]